MLDTTTLALESVFEIFDNGLGTRIYFSENKIFGLNESIVFENNNRRREKKIFKTRIQRLVIIVLLTRDNNM